MFQENLYSKNSNVVAKLPVKLLYFDIHHGPCTAYILGHTYCKNMY